MTYDPYNPKQPGDPYGQQPGQPYGQPMYGQQPMYGYGYPPPVPKPQTSAILALVLSLVGLASCGITAIVGVVFGHLAMGKIRRGEEEGRGMALAGIIIGYVVIAGWLLYAAVIIIAVIAAANQSTY